MKESLFFVSSGRTGTHFLQTFFSQYVNNCYSTWEPKPAFRRRSRELVSRSSSLYEKIYFTSFRMARYLPTGHDYYVEANHNLFSAIPMVRKCFSNSKIIHIIRDARDVIQSYMNAFKRYSRSPYGNNELQPKHFDHDAYSDEWQTMSPIEKTAWFWLRVNEIIESHEPDYTIYFEDLFSSPHTPIHDLISEFDGLTLKSESLEEAFSRKESATDDVDYVPDWEEWPKTWKKQFVSICGAKMSDYGYDIDH